ncbi:BTAD domain-containing putative transcriptional regulator [Kutzneria buriramensis]|uniref:BTAD domain-containing putative transcriptional regulator n=1 Tax=Kutzneria buriramensis TaxID=1045776 RepID=UPI000E286B10|nr:BTAD domain-containing putative transcriptional regulator [Kutzneria buriramensis]
MQVLVLGPVRVRADDGTPIEVGGARLRMLLARLALDAGRPVAADLLTAGLWGDTPPADTANALQSLVSRLRKVLGGPARLTSSDAGYVLKVEYVDADRFEETAARGRRELAAGRHDEAARLLGEALGLWQGDALSDVLDAPFARPPATRLEELRLAAVEDRFEAELELGRHADVLADLETAGRAHPLRERLVGLRMRALYAAGRQSDALAVFERTRVILAEELGVDPSTELRDVHLAVLRGEIASARPETDHLPVRLTSFVGRRDELDHVARALDAGRLVTVIGPGGAGKTRLATEAAARHPAHRRGRVWFVALAGVRDPGDVTGAVVSALDMLPIRRSHAIEPVDAVGHIAELVGGGDAVLVLDNCEHLLDAAAELAHELLARVPGLRVLATSREPLAITGEALCQLGPLDAPEAMRLFTERAATVRPGCTLEDDAVAEICRRLDGLPLALELAAARLRSMTVEQIVERLNDRFRLLTSGSRVALPRQRTLRAVVEWSWDLLAEPERALARRLAVFPGAVTVPAAEAVCADESLPADDVFPVLCSLVEKSIVDIRDGRYRMLETIRAYAEERLDEAGERDAVAGRFAEHYLRIAEADEAALRSADQLRAIATFEAEHPNMIAALRRAIDADDAVTACRFALVLNWYWLVRGWHEQLGEFMPGVLRFEGRVPADTAAALRAVYALIDGVPAAGLARAIIDDCVRSGAIERFPALSLVVPLLAFVVGEHELAERETRRVLARSDPWARACAHSVQASMFDNAGDLVAGERVRAEALAGFQAVGDRWGIAMTLGMQAAGNSLRGDHERAIAQYQHGLAMARELSSVQDMVQHLYRLALERMRAGDVEGAMRELDQAGQLADQPETHAMVRLATAELARRSGDLTLAHVALDKLRPELDDLPPHAGVAAEMLTMTTAALLITEGRSEPARELLAGALRKATPPDGARAAELAGRLFALEGKPELAASTLGLSEAIRGAFDAGDPELATLVASLCGELTTNAYRAAYDRGAALSKPEAIERLLAEFS